MNGDSLSKRFQLQDAVNRALTRLSINAPADNYIGKFVKEINVAQYNIAKKLRDENPLVKTLYEQTATISFVSGECTFNTIEQANPLIVEPARIDLYDITGTVRKGEVAFISEKEFPHLNESQIYDNTILHTISGRRYQLFCGRNLDVTLYTFKAIYIRQVNVLTFNQDWLDVPDTSFDDLVKALEQIFATQKKEEAPAQTQ